MLKYYGFYIILRMKLAPELVYLAKLLFVVIPKSSSSKFAKRLPFVLSLNNYKNSSSSFIAGSNL